MELSYRCAWSGRLAWVTSGLGLWPLAFCICGHQIIVTEDIERTGKDNKYVVIPEHRRF